MKRNAILLAMFSIMALWLSGCILQSSPTTSEVTIKTGDSQTFTVSGVANGLYTWTKAGIPIDGVTTASYTYTAALADLGTFTLKVSTKDSFNVTSEVAWSITVVDDLPPIANAGPDQDLFFGNPVTLDGSLSSDPEGQPLSYVWEIVGKPAGSSASLDNPNSKNPIFVPDKQGAYTIILIVNDGRLTSNPDTVIINSYTNYSPPTANAGADQSIVYGNNATLDGSLSTDPENTPLTYKWRIDSGPAGSGATIDDPTSMTPVFMPDLKGVYVLSLVVNNGVFNSGIDLVTIIVYNNPPVAYAGTDVTIPVLGGSTTLNGAGSADPDAGTTLSYAWTIISKPYGSIAPLSNPFIVNPTFTPDKKGAYIVKLIVSDGDLFSNTDTVIVTCSNQVPVANAGDPINIEFNQTAQLNGSPTDPDNDLMTYAWTVTGKPTGSSALPSNATILNPTFKPDVQGDYELTLIATDNTGLSSAPSTVIISTENHQPLANAGDDIIMPSNSSVVLNGSGTDADSDPLTYTWRVITAPMDSGADTTLSALDIAKPTFTPDKKGDYLLGLVVNDGQIDSVEDTMKIHVINNPPIAEAGQSKHLNYTNRFVTLDGSVSIDPDGDPLTYSWRIISKPSGSNATIVNPTAVNPTIELDVPNEDNFIIGLIVNDGAIDSSEDTVTLAYGEKPPVAVAAALFQSLHIPFGTPVTFLLDGSGSYDEDGDPITYTWRVISGTGTLSDTSAEKPTLTKSDIGDCTLGLIVNDGFMNSTAESTVTLTTTNIAPTAAPAGSPMSQHIRKNTSVTFQLYGNGTDADSDTLTYTWTIKSGTGTLSDSHAVNPTLTKNDIGTCTLGLIVNDGWINSTESTVTVTTTNATPVANAGPAQSIHPSTLPLVFQLNGSGSSDIDIPADTLTYTWTIKSGTGTLSDIHAVSPTLTKSDIGACTLGLIVNDGWVNSTESTVTVTTSNYTPVANAGSAQSTHWRYETTAPTFQLNGSGSSDGDSDSLSYTWRVISRPSGSTAGLSSTNIVNPTITADTIGVYTIGLIVNDGFVNSAESTLTVTTTNAEPSVGAGANQYVLYNDRAHFHLNGNVTDDDGDPLTYVWTQTDGTGVTLNDANTASPWFVYGGLPGVTYKFSLVVSDGWSSKTYTATVTNSTVDDTTSTFEGSSWDSWTEATRSGSLGSVGPNGGRFRTVSASKGLQSSGWVRITKTYSKPITNVSISLAWDRSTAANGKPSADHYENSTKIVTMGQSGSANSWQTYTYSYLGRGRVYTNVSFQANVNGGYAYTTNTQYFDNIVVTYWN